MPSYPLSDILYISFDTVPNAKGAGVHIEAFCKILAEQFAPVHLLTVAEGIEPIPTYTMSDRLYHTQLPARGKNLIDRVIDFRQRVRQWLTDQHFRVIHFRSIFEGFWLVREQNHYADYFIFEVNGLPSIELKYRYPQILDDPDLLQKLKAQENYCLQKSDVVITPSPVTANFLEKRGTNREKIQIIPNGVDPELFTPALEKIKSDNFTTVYFGTFASWQGWELAVRAIAQLPDNFQLKLIGHGNKLQLRSVQKLVRKLNISQRVQLLPAMFQSQLVKHLQTADAIVAPLTLCDRNVVQGCCPLKILEGMAVGVPVVASDLPVVKCLGRDREHFLLVRPNSVDGIVSALKELFTDALLAQKLAQQGRWHILENFTWQKVGEQLLAVYRSLDYSSTHQ
ncbi:MAG: glycosyltransferase family 4 protein [Pseudanabaenaceae cyanobacterium]